MAEHDEKLFEQELAEIFAKMDSKIEIPEIPDVRTIFDKAEAEEKKTNAVPFKKYSKYIAAAAAVVLICAGVPVLANALSGGISMDNAAEAMEPETAQETMEEPSSAPSETYVEIFDSLTAESNERSESASHNEEDFVPEAEEEAEINPSSGDSGMKEALPEEVINAPHSSASSSSETLQNDTSVKEILYRYFAATANENPNTGGGGYDDVRYITENINKKRTIELSIENGSVSVILHDNSANKEIINAFWIEGNYESSYLEGEYYIINLSKKVAKTEFEEDNYLPMVGDVNGTFTIPESKIFVPGKVNEGVISMTVSVQVGTGEYEIYSSLV
ncbi:MAG: hypothetical protein IKJ82_03725 [Oscillospiraceae bacterium]|nr:hypothetical protein [Oscillospiraceae bacterium]